MWSLQRLLSCGWGGQDEEEGAAPERTLESLQAAAAQAREDPSADQLRTESTQPSQAGGRQNVGAKLQPEGPQLTSQTGTERRQNGAGTSYVPELPDGGLGDGSGQFQLGRDVYLRIEFISERETRVLLFGQYVALLLGLGLLAWLVYAQHAYPASWWVTGRAFPIVNLVLATLCLAALLATALAYARRCIRASRSGRKWSLRRKRLATLVWVELTLAGVAVLALLLNNALELSNECPKLDVLREEAAAMSFIMWTCLNALFVIVIVQITNVIPVSRLHRLTRWLPVLAARAEAAAPPSMDALVLDLPWWFHMPKAVLFLAVEVPLVFMLLTILGKIGPVSGGDCPPHGLCGSITITPIPGQPCTQWPVSCSTTTSTYVIMSAMSAAFLLHILLFFLFYSLAIREYRLMPYTQHRVIRVILAYWLNTRITSALFFALNLVLLWYAQMGSCASYAEARLGFTPLTLVVTGLVTTSALLYLPKAPGQREIELHAWLQDFAWLESSVPRKIQERQARPEEPLFCFETSLKLLYWSALAYYLEGDGLSRQPELSLPTALGLLGLSRWEVLCEPARDSKVLLAWGRRSVLVSFRGTDNLANVIEDMKVWRVPHPPKRGSYFLGTQPMVHTGFWQTFAANDLGRRVLERVAEIMREGGCDCDSSSGGSSKEEEMEGQGGGEGGGVRGPGARHWRLYFTGHSLGGALATLAAFDAARALEAGELAVPPELCQIQCYVYGAPRTGNHAWAREYKRLVPNTWLIVNDNDAVVAGGKFLLLFKHCGQRVILLNPTGDMIVRPSFIEQSQLNRWQASLAKHLLRSYQASYKAVIGAQFASRKGTARGRRALKKLLNSQYVQDMLVNWELPRESLATLLRTPTFIEPHQPGRGRQQQQGLGQQLAAGGQAGLHGVGTALTAVVDAERRAVEAVGGAALGLVAGAPPARAALAGAGPMQQRLTGGGSVQGLGGQGLEVVGSGRIGGLGGEEDDTREGREASGEAMV